MPFVAAPGIARHVISGTIGAQPWATIMYWRDGTSTAPFSQTALDTLITAFNAAFNTQFTAGMSNNVSIKSEVVVDIGSATGLSSVYSGSAITGGFGTALTPASLCGNYQYKIAPRYRGGHPRGFWPVLVQTQLLGENSWNPATVGPYTTKFSTMITTMQTSMAAGGWATPTHTVPRWTYTVTDDPVHHKYHRQRTGYSHSDNVVGYQLQSIVGQQRNRLRN